MLKSMSDLLGELQKLNSEQRAEIVNHVHELSMAEGRFQYRAEDCDVMCKEQLRQFRVLKLKWLFWFRDDEHHAISKQIDSLLADYALFRTLNDLRLKAAKAKPQCIGFNVPTLALLDSGFVAKQAMGIRRLIDKSDDAVSLKRLLDDIKQNRGLITREVYVANDGLPYDYACVEDAYYAEKIKEHGKDYCEGVETTGPKAWTVAKRNHKFFDKLSQTSNNQRNRDDILPEQWFDNLSNKLGICYDIQKFADKFIAHPANSSSRTKLSDGQKIITLNKLAKCHQAIVAVANEVSRWILGEASSWSVPQPSFKNLDKGWVTEGALDNVSELWDKHMVEIEKWSSNAHP